MDAGAVREHYSRAQCCRASRSGVLKSPNDVLFEGLDTATARWLFFWAAGYYYGGHGRRHARSEFKEEFRDGNCRVKRELQKDGDYKEERKCKGRQHAHAPAPVYVVPQPVVVAPQPVYVPSPAVVVRPGVVIQGTIHVK